MAKKPTYYQKKVRRARQKYVALLAKPDFQKDVLAFRKKWLIPANGLGTDNAYKKWKCSFPKKGEGEYYTNLQTILKKHKIDPRHELTIRRYCLYNNPCLPISMLGVVTIQTEDKEGENYTLRLVIGPNTTLEDVKQVWSFVKEEQKKLLLRKHKIIQPLRYFDRNKLAYDLQQKGKTLREIAKIINKKYGSQFAYSDISNLIRSHKKNVAT